MKIEEILSNGKSNKTVKTIVRILNGLDGLTNNPYVNETTGTREVKTRLCEIGRGGNCHTCASGVDNSDREWLYDVAWLNYVEEDPQKPLLRIRLAAECEWGDSEESRMTSTSWSNPPRIFG